MKKQRFFLQGIWLGLAIFQLLSLPQLARAKYIGGDPPKCQACACSLGGGCTRPGLDEPSNTSSSISRTEGNLTERMPISRVGTTLSLSFVYNSYNSDGSRATVNTVAGYGWTHSLNVFLFSQLGSMFRYDGEGRVTRYALGAGGTYTAATGYFETLVKNPDGSFTLTQKDKTVYQFQSVAGTPFLVGGPVWRVTSMSDRNGNVTTYTYSGGNLTQVTDTYGRALQFTYNASGHVTAVTDPAGRITRFTYDSTGHMLSTVTDPLGSTTRYTYNALYQITTKYDKAGRQFNYLYSGGLPVAIYDSSNTGPATMSNSANWSTNATQLALNQLRVYNPSTTTNTDGRGNQWKYQYDANGYLLQTTAPDNAITRYTYDAGTLQLANMTDANGDMTSYTYDAKGNTLSKTDALHNVTEWTYDSIYNQVTRLTDARGRMTTYTIDPATGNRTQETDPLGQTNSWTYDSHGNVLTFTDKNSHTTKYTYDSFGNRITATDPLNNLTSWTYDAVGNVISMTDANMHTTSYQYDGMNRLIKTTDAMGHIDQTFYDGEGNSIETIDRNGHATFYQYDLRQRLTKQTDATGHFDSFTYDGNDNRITSTDRNSHATTYFYDVQNRPVKVTDALGDMTQTSYDPVGNMTSRTDANGHTTGFTYDALNRRATMTDALGGETQYFYDGGTFGGTVDGQSCNQCGATPGSSIVSEQIDPDGSAGLHAGVTFYKYDALDRLILVIRKTGCIGAACPDMITASDAVTSTMYDPVGNRISVTEPDGDTTTDSYDADNRLTQEVNSAGDTTSTSYDGVGNVLTRTEPNLNITTNMYDSLNRLIKVTDNAGAVETGAYDAVGNRTSSADGDGHVTSYFYDALNRQIQVTDPLGESTSTQYDPVGNVVSMIDRNGNITLHSYDFINRRSSMTDALGNVTQWQYDAVGNTIRLTDANGHATQYFYDALNRPMQETYPDMLSRSYTYDPASNLTSRKDQKSQTTAYTYNDLYFLIGRAYPVSGTDTFTYDLSGRMLSAQHGGWPVTFTYDGADRLTNTTQNGVAISYVYNIPGRTRQIVYPNGRQITEHTDARWRMDHINDAAFMPSIAQYSYDAANNVLSRNYGNGTTSSFAYNANNWTTNITHNNPSTFAGFAYAYDNEGNKNYELKTPNTQQSECYGYDADYRLISFQSGTAGSPNPCPVAPPPIPPTQTSYTLDPVGNWTAKTTNGVMQSRSYNADNELVQIGVTPVTYDLNGNTLNDGVFTYVHDEENRLISVTRIADSVVVGQYQYDALSRRVMKIADPAAVISSTVYYYDGDRVIQEQNSLAVGPATYVYGNYVDEILTMDLGGATSYYHQNALWSVEAITDGTGAAVERYAYDAYGAITVMDGSFNPIMPNPWGTPHSAIGNPYLFTGQRLDEDTGIYYYKARYYDSVKGRFLQRDSLGYVDSMNLYAYAGNRPTFFTDPFGESGVPPWLSAATPEELRELQRLQRVLEELKRFREAGSGSGTSTAVQNLVRRTNEQLRRRLVDAIKGRFAAAASRQAAQQALRQAAQQGLRQAAQQGLRRGGGPKFSIGPSLFLFAYADCVYGMLSELDDRFEELEQFKRRKAEEEALWKKLEPWVNPCCGNLPRDRYIGPMAGSVPFSRGALDEKDRPYWISECEYQWRLKFKDLPPLEGESYPRAWWLAESDTPFGPRVTSGRQP
jgi:RHS repeat-associated protein